MSLFFPQMTKSVCTGTRALVRALPSGHISEEVWEVVGTSRNWRPSKKEIGPILRCGRRRKDEFGVCREMQRLVWPGIMDQMVRVEHCRAAWALQVTQQLAVNLRRSASKAL